MDRSKHLQWCKDRAMAHVSQGEFINAFASMVSDIKKHDETNSHAGLELGAMLLFGGQLKTEQQMTKWIQGFN